MKKLMILAVAAIALVACSKTFDTGVRTSEGKAIGFGTWTNVLTKARANAHDSTAFKNGEAFDVFGFKTVGSDNLPVFTGDNVTATVTVDTVTWDYDPHRFWDTKASSYTFYAVLPADSLAAISAADSLAGKFVSNTITFGDPTDFKNDILIADKEVVLGTGGAAPYSYTNPVSIKFNHAASCVELKVKKDAKLDAAVVKVTDLTLLGIRNKGSFAVSDYTNNVPEITWTPDNTPSHLADLVVLSSANVVASDTTHYVNHLPHVATEASDTLFAGYVFMPQAIVDDEQQIKLTYSIQVGSEGENVYEDIIIDFADFRNSDSDDNSAGTAINEWAPKTKYIYTITIGANAIEFTASVKDWSDTVSGYQYLIN